MTLLWDFISVFSCLFALSFVAIKISEEGVTFKECIHETSSPYFLVGMVLSSIAYTYTSIVSDHIGIGAFFKIIIGFIGLMLIALSWAGAFGLSIRKPEKGAFEIFEYFEKRPKTSRKTIFAGICLIVFQIALDIEKLASLGEK